MTTYICPAKSLRAGSRVTKHSFMTLGSLLVYFPHHWCPCPRSDMILALGRTDLSLITQKYLYK